MRPSRKMCSVGSCAPLAASLGSLLLAGGVAAEEQTKNIMGREVTRKQWEQAQAFERGLREFSRRRPTWYRPPEYDRSLPPQDIKAAQLRSALRSAPPLRISEFFGKLGVAGELFVVPNLAYARVVSLSGLVVRDARGKKRRFVLPKDPRGALSGAKLAFRCQLAGSQTLPKDLSKWRGRIKVALEVPLRWKVVRLSTKTPSVAGVSFRIDAQRGVIVTSRLPAFERAVIRAHDRQGRLLARQGSQRDVPELSNVLRRSWAELPARVTMPKAVERRFIGRYRGEVVSIAVFLPGKRQRIKQVFRLSPNKTDQAVFSEPGQMRLCPPGAPASIAVRAIRSVALASWAQPGLAVELPKCDSSLFARVELGALKFFDRRGRPLAEVEEQNSGFSRESLSEQRYFSPTRRRTEHREDASFPQLASVKGKVTVTLRRLELVSLDRRHSDSACFGLSLSKTSIALKKKRAGCLADSDGYLPPYLQPIRVFDAQGRLLARTPRMDHRGDTLIQYYRRAPHSVKLLAVRGESTQTREFSLTYPRLAVAKKR